MPNIEFDDITASLPLATTSADGDEIEIYQAGTRKRVTKGILLSGITAGSPPDDSVTTAKIQAEAVNNAKVAPGIDAVKLANGTITNTKLQYLSGVTSPIQAQINNISTSGGPPPDNSVSTGKLVDAAVTNSKVAAGIDAVKLADGTITNTELQHLNGVTSPIQTQINNISTSGGGGGGTPTYAKIANTTNLDDQIAAAIADSTAVIEAEVTSNLAITTARTGANAFPVNLLLRRVNDAQLIITGAGKVDFAGIGFTPDDLMSGKPAIVAPEAVTLAFHAGAESLIPMTPVTWNTSTNVITQAGSAYVNNTKVRYLSTGAPIPGFIIGEYYWIRDAVGATFKVSSYKGGAANPIAAEATASHYFTSEFSAIGYDAAIDKFLKPNHEYLTGTKLAYYTQATRVVTNSEGGDFTGKFFTVNVTAHTFQLAGTSTGGSVSLGTPLNVTAQTGSHFLFSASVGVLEIYPDSGSFYKQNIPFSANDEVLYWTDDEPLAPLVSGNKYYVAGIAGVGSADSQFGVSLTPGGAKILFTRAGTGTHFLSKSAVRFTGAIVPREISSKFIDTGVSSVQSRLTAVTSSLLGKATTVHVEAGTFDSRNSLLLSKHKYEFEPHGIFPSNYDGDLNLAPLLLSPNLTINFNWATLYESTIFGKPRIVCQYTLNAVMGRIEAEKVTLAATIKDFTGSSQSTVSFGNVKAGYFKEFEFLDTGAYSLQIGGGSVFNDYASDFVISDGYFKDVPNQQFFFLNCKRIRVHRMRHYHRHRTEFSAVYDFEPNDARFDQLEDITLSDIEFDYEVTNGTSLIQQLIAVNFAGNRGIKNIKIRNLHAKCSSQVLNGITGQGVDGLYLDNVNIEGVRDIGLHLVGGNDVRIKNSSILRTTTADASNAAVAFFGIRNGVIDNLQTDRADDTGIYAKGYYENELNAFLGSTVGNKITMNGRNETSTITYYAAGVQAVEGWVGGTVVINNTNYKITASQAWHPYIGTQKTFTTAETLPTLSVKSVLPASVDPATDIWTVPAHNYITGCRLYVDNTGGALPAHTAPANERGMILPLHYAIVLTTGTIKLAATLANALAATPVAIDFTNAGTGRHRLTPVLKTAFLNTQITDSDIETYDILPDSKTRIISRKLEGQATAAEFASNGGNSSFGRGDAGKRYSNIASSGVVSDNGTTKGGELLELAAIGSGSMTFLAGADKTIFYNGTSTGVNGRLRSTVPGSFAKLERVPGGYLTQSAIGTWTAVSLDSLIYTLKYKIDCGGATAPTGWVLDGSYLTTGGDGVIDYGETANLNGQTDPPPNAVIQSVRYTNSATPIVYTLTGLTANAEHKLRLHFYQSTAGGETFTFDVTINGVLVFNDYCIPTAAGGLGRLITAEPTVTANGSGVITVRLDMVNVQAKISGIEVYQLP